MTSNWREKSFRLVGIIGDPIDHSRSPAMQNAAFRSQALPFLYLPFHVKRGAVGQFMRQARRWGLAGFNVTIPHKVSIVKYCDQLSPEARAIGAVNTVVRRGRQWIGTNTDGIGYLRSLSEEVDFRPQGKCVVILGAGGASRSIAVSLLRSRVRRLVVANRTLSRARRLGSNLKRLFPRQEIEAISLSGALLKEAFHSADLLVNATSIGWRGTRLRGLPLGALPRRAIVSDLVYENATPLLKQAKKRRLKSHGGLGMLIHQGAEGFRLWTGRRPDLKAMKRAVP